MIKHIFQYISYNSSILVAYSGGLDSTVLLHQLINIKKKNPSLKIRAIHINHNINVNSQLWINHCIQKCHIYKITLVVKSIQKIIQNKNIEHQLRHERYTLIKQHILPQEILVTGHNLNDQIETILLALKRGSGPTGLQGILEFSYFGKNKIIRPLLKIERSQIERWALCNNLNWIQDHSNTDMRFDRNFLRSKIIPLLYQRWPGFLKNCATTAKICSSTEKIINSLSQKLFKKYSLPDTSLNISTFNTLSEDFRNLILRYWIYQKTNLRISYTKTKIIYNEVINAKKDKNPRFIFYQYEIRRYKHNIYCMLHYPSIKNLILFWHKPWNKLQLPYNLGNITHNHDQYHNSKISMPKYNEQVNIRFQFTGSIFTEKPYQKTKIKKYGKK
ncbi:tRNA lysidine(34) synthetase TilS [Buchnera aphidicola (Hormaphis cornu)]|nr:tRNA lysidine(34) synthetase TilS [Buchnera aphidicola (Hormaphis cornu)]